MKNKLIFNELETAVLQAIENAGGKVYIVGGLVRDLLIYKDVDYHDVDVEVYHLSIEALQDILASFGKVDEIGKSFGILKLSVLPHFDFALPRTEVKVDTGHLGFEVTVDENLDLYKACKRRDITINALLYEYSSGEILDFFGGLEDINQQCIRMVNPDTFKEDPLRVLRIAQFASRLEYYVDSRTKEHCRQMVKEGLLQSLSNERVYQEYCKLLMSRVPSIGLTFLKDIQALPKYLDALQSTKQRLDYHPEGNVWNHTLLVVDMAALVKDRTSNPLSFMWSCLLHDIGKPIVTTDKGHAPGHDKAGVQVFKEECRNWIASSTMQKYIITMIQYHMTIMNMVRNNGRDITYLRLLKSIEGIFPLQDLILMSKCDKLGRLRDSHEDIRELDRFIKDKQERLGNVAYKPIVTGQDLLELGYIESRQFKEMLDVAYDRQLQGYNKEAIIKYIRKQY